MYCVSREHRVYISHSAVAQLLNYSKNVETRANRFWQQHKKIIQCIIEWSGGTIHRAAYASRILQ